MAYRLGTYIPDCSDPIVRQQIKDGLLPSNICDYPPEVLAQICERSPSLCQPYGGAVAPSIWEPIFGTAQDIGTRVLSTGQAVGSGALGTLDLATVLVKLAPLLIVGGGLLFIMREFKR